MQHVRATGRRACCFPAASKAAPGTCRGGLGPHAVPGGQMQPQRPTVAGKMQACCRPGAGYCGQSQEGPTCLSCSTCCWTLLSTGGFSGSGPRVLTSAPISGSRLRVQGTGRVGPPQSARRGLRRPAARRCPGARGPSAHTPPAGRSAHLIDRLQCNLRAGAAERQPLRPAARGSHAWPAARVLAWRGTAGADGRQICLDGSPSRLAAPSRGVRRCWRWARCRGCRSRAREPPTTGRPAMPTYLHYDLLASIYPLSSRLLGRAC
jgi:hypothetical protein